MLGRTPGRGCSLFALVVLLELVASVGFSQPARATGRYDVVAEGAVGDGKVLNTEVINRLIARVSAAGGGTVYFPPGDFLTGSLILQSNVTLQLEAGTTLLGSTDIADYPENKPPRATTRLEYGRFALIGAEGQHDVAIIGRGRILGQGNHPNFTKKDLMARGVSSRDAYLKRPFGLSFVHCQRVLVQGIKLENIAFWCEDYLDCDDVVVEGVTVDSRKNDYNNDGIDIDGSRHVRVSNCTFNAGDDAICLKASYRDCENVVVTNCTASSLANGVKFGTATNCGFKNIAISNITLDGVNAAGIALEIVDGGTLDGVTLTNFSMRDVGTAIFIRLGAMSRRWTEDTPKNLPVGKLRNLTLSSIIAHVRGSDPRPLASSITGLPGHPVENVQISHVQIISERSFPSDAKKLDFHKIPEAAESYPENGMFGALPAHGLYLRHVHKVDLSDISLELSGEDSRPALLCDDVTGLAISGFRGQVTPQASAVVVFNDVHDALIRGAEAREGASVFLDVEGQTDRVVLSDNALVPDVEVVHFGANVPPSAAITR